MQTQLPSRPRAMNQPSQPRAAHNPQQQQQQHARNSPAASTHSQRTGHAHAHAQARHAPPPQPTTPSGFASAQIAASSTASLPPQHFTTAAALLSFTDKKVVITLRDARKLIGVLRSWDQYGNLVLTETIERRVLTITERDTTPQSAGGRIAQGQGQGQGTSTTKAIPKRYAANLMHGVYLVRGENITLVGEVDLDKEDEPIPHEANVEEVSEQRLHELIDKFELRQKSSGRMARRARRMRRLGMEDEGREYGLETSMSRCLSAGEDINF